MTSLLFQFRRGPPVILQADSCQLIFTASRVGVRVLLESIRVREGELWTP